MRTWQEKVHLLHAIVAAKILVIHEHAYLAFSGIEITAVNIARWLLNAFDLNNGHAGYARIYSRDVHVLFWIILSEFLRVLVPMEIFLADLTPISILFLMRTPLPRPL